MFTAITACGPNTPSLGVLGPYGHIRWSDAQKTLKSKNGKIMVFLEKNTYPAKMVQDENQPSETLPYIEHVLFVIILYLDAHIRKYAEKMYIIDR